RHSWESFEGGYATNTSCNRLLSGLGSNRYDFYRVALDEFASHPLLGIGADNFQQSYLRLGHSEETPRYPHSVELRTLTQTGLAGALLALVGLGAALVAGWRAMRRRDDPLAAAIAAAALAGFTYWAVHGSFDWFFEFAGLGAPAFALLGLGCALAPEGDAGGTPQRGASSVHEGDAGAIPQRGASGVHEGDAGAIPQRGTRRTRVWHPSGSALTLALLSLLGLAAAASLAAPCLGERQVQSAAAISPKAPLDAYSRLGDAAKLNPLRDRACLVEGSIALRFGDLSRAERAFSRALGRVPDDAYAALELGAIASESGARVRALGLLERAVRLNPRDPLTRQALHTVQAGRPVDVRALNRAILLKA